MRLCKTQDKADRFVVKARWLGLRAGLDPAGLNKLADELDVEGFLIQARRARKR